MFLRQLCCSADQGERHRKVAEAIVGGCYDAGFDGEVVPGVERLGSHQGRASATFGEKIYRILTSR